MSYNLYGKPLRGTTAWAAQRIQRLLEREEREAKERAERALIEEAAPFALRDHTVGSDAWAVQQIRLIQQREAREMLDDLSGTYAQQRPFETSSAENTPHRQTAHRPVPLPSRGLLAAGPTPPRTTARDPRLQPVVAPAIPWIINGATQIPAWISRLAPLFGLAPLMRGDAEKDDFCDRRFEAEANRCARWSQEWQRSGCRNRAMERYASCLKNSGQPDPNEVDEWSERDNEVWHNPERFR